MTAASDPAAQLDAEFATALRHMFEQQIVFNRLLGLQLTHMGGDCVRGQIAMRDDLIGHFGHQRIHGGVISAALDAMGGAAVMVALGLRHRDEAPLKRMERFSKLGTIDLRIDYLRPGVGAAFALKADVLRLGSRVASTRMEFSSTDGKLLAAGSGVYIVA